MKAFTALLCFSLLSFSHVLSSTEIIAEDCSATEDPASFALDMINKHLEEGFILSLLRVVDAHRQPVGDGNIHYLTMDVLETECYFLSRRHWRDCEIKPLFEMVFGSCKAVIYLNLPSGEVKLYNYNCTLSSTPPHLIASSCPDCPILVKDTAPYQDKFERMVVKYNRKSNNTNYFKFAQIISVYTQWVLVEIYHLEFTIRETNCSRLDTDLSDCEFLEDNQALVGFCKGTTNNHPYILGLFESTPSCELYYLKDPSIIPQDDDVVNETSPSSCADRKLNVEEDCHFRTDTEGEKHKCRAQVYSSGRANKTIVLSQDCNFTASGRDVLLPYTMCRECARPVRRVSQELGSILKHSIKKFNDESDHPSHFKVGEVTKAKKQVVYGSIYEIEYIVQETNCSKDEITHGHPGCRKNEDTRHHCHGRRYCPGHRHGHRHGKGHRHHHHHKGTHHQKEDNAQKPHDSSSEEQAGLKPTPPPARQPIGLVQRIDLVNETDVFAIPIIPDPSHPMDSTGSPSMQEHVGPGPIGPVKDAEPQPFPRVPSDSPGCPAQPKSEVEEIVSLLPVHK